MPLHDRRTMEGVYSVAQTAQMMRQYRYAEEQMMRIMAGLQECLPSPQASYQLRDALSRSRRACSGRPPGLRWHPGSRDSPAARPS